MGRGHRCESQSCPHLHPHIAALPGGCGFTFRVGGKGLSRYAWEFCDFHTSVSYLGKDRRLPSLGPIDGTKPGRNAPLWDDRIRIQEALCKLESQHHEMMLNENEGEGQLLGSKSWSRKGNMAEACLSSSSL